MSDQWFFEIGDGQTYGPFPLEKLRKWAAAGNLMPTHRVRQADQTEWTIAAYVPGLEITTADTAVLPDPPPDADPRGRLGALVSALTGGNRNKGEGPSHQETDVIALCDELLEICYKRKASDLHIDPEENVTLIQIRVDGLLETLRKVPKALQSPILSRFKVLAKMDIAERRMAQDGSFFQTLGEDQRRVHMRAAVLPTTHGERLTIRLLAVETEQLTLQRLGMSELDLRTFASYAGLPQGMILLSGPTGSGKSTTLYAALRHRLAQHPGRVITIEEPVEYDIVGVSQIEVDTSDKVRMDTILRNILRSDPDVIMIGEMRDRESANVAIKAALTGHLVFSSIHTNSAAGVITRLIDMGIEPFQVAATLKLCIAQRLARKLCPDCRKPRKLSAAEAAALGRRDAAGATVYEPGVCRKCKGRGYRGRVGLFELLPIDEEIAHLVVKGAKESDINIRARELKIPTLRDDAAAKLLAGATTFDEIIAVSAW